MAEDRVSGVRLNGFPLSVEDYLQAIVPVAADARIAYGTGASQWIDVYRPPGRGPFPVVLLIHGGCWSTVATAETVGPNAAELAARGMVVFNLEYRRVGEAGGGYPGTYLDLSRAMDTIAEQAEAFELDLGRIVVVGHSAGAHLALWIGSRHNLPAGSELASPSAVAVRTVVAIAGPGDLRHNFDLLGITCAGMSTGVEVVGAASPLRPDPFADTSPFEILPTGTRTLSITGIYDDNWPPYVSARWHRAALAAGDEAEEILLPDFGHFEVVDIRSPAWILVREAILSEVARTA